MSIVIERASSIEAKAILEYLQQIGKETDNLTFGSEGVSVTVEQEAAYIAQLEDSCDGVMLLAKDEGKIVGDVSLMRQPRRMRHRGELGISVLKEYWNKGIGSQLLCEILKFAKENRFEVIDLQVRSDNQSAIHLYKKFGFEKIGMHPAFFKIGNEEITFDYMYCRIQQPNKSW